MRGNRGILILLGILVIGLVFRLYNLTFQSIWIDESFSIHAALQSLQHVLTLIDPTPPFHNLLLWGWIKLFGISALAVRSLSVLISMISIYVIYLLGKRYSQRTGLFAAFLLAISPIHVWYAQEARAYALLFLLSMLSMYFYLKFLDKPDKINILGYIIISTLMMYTHLFGFLILLVQFLHFIFVRKHWKEWISCMIAIAFLFVPWLLKLPEIISMNFVSFTSLPERSLSIFHEVYNAFLFGKTWPLIGGVIMLLYAYLFIRHIFSKRRSPVMILWLFVPVLAVYVFSVFVTPIFLIRYVLISSIPMFLILAIELARTKRPQLLIMLIAIVLFTVPAIYVQQNMITKDPWKEISGYLDDAQIGVVAYYEALPLAYYRNPDCLVIGKSHQGVYDCLKKYDVYALRDPDSVYLNDKRIILITSHLETVDSKNILEAVNQRYSPEASKSFYEYEPMHPRFFNTMVSENYNEITVLHMRES